MLKEYTFNSCAPLNYAQSGARLSGLNLYVTIVIMAFHHGIGDWALGPEPKSGNVKNGNTQKINCTRTRFHFVASKTNMMTFRVKKI